MLTDGFHLQANTERVLYTIERCSVMRYRDTEDRWLHVQLCLRDSNNTCTKQMVISQPLDLSEESMSRHAQSSKVSGRQV